MTLEALPRRPQPPQLTALALTHLSICEGEDWVYLMGPPVA